MFCWNDCLKVPWVWDGRPDGIAVPADTDCQETIGSTVQTCPSVPEGQGEPHSFFWTFCHLPGRMKACAAAFLKKLALCPHWKNCWQGGVTGFWACWAPWLSCALGAHSQCWCLWSCPCSQAWLADTSFFQISLSFVNDKFLEGILLSSSYPPFSASFLGQTPDLPEASGCFVPGSFGSCFSPPCASLLLGIERQSSTVALLFWNKVVENPHWFMRGVDLCNWCLCGHWCKMWGITWCGQSWNKGWMFRLWLIMAPEWEARSSHGLWGRQWWCWWRFSRMVQAALVIN